jgi:NAD(P)-dependent dehydrogenase (short-subunit alcohol dehydrogenase family)
VLTSELLSKQALNGMLMPDDVAGAYLFLASQHAKDITGQTLHVDRGEVMD